MASRVPVVLLQPPGVCRDFTRSGSLYPPLGLCHLAATVDRDAAVVVDADGSGFDDATTLATIEALAPSVSTMRHASQRPAQNAEASDVLRRKAPHHTPTHKPPVPAARAMKKS